MKVLWFANTPCEAIEKLSIAPVTGGGWLYALSQEVKNNPEIELHIAFYWGKALESFTYKGIHYHPVLRSGDDSKLGRYIHRVRSQFSSCYDAIEVPRLLDVVSQINPDIIHIHGSEENFGLIANHINSEKICLSIQGMLSPILNKYFAGIPKEIVKKHSNFIRKFLLDDTLAAYRRFSRNARREVQIYRKIRNIIGRTQWDERCSLALNPNRAYYVCNEILRDDFFKNVWQTPTNQKFTIVSTISNGLWKGVETIYQAAQILQNAGFNFEWKILGIEANDSNSLLSERFTSFSSNSPCISFKGRKSSSEMIHELQSSDLFIQVSRIENSPNSLCEAMLLGMPIIATFVGGTSSMLQDGEEGVLVQEGEPYVLAGSIINCKQEYAKFVKMGANARKRALIRHSPKNVVNELMNVYNSMINK